MLSPMSDSKPYRAADDELVAIDEALGQEPATDADLAEYNRSFAKLLRLKADQAETVEMRIFLLEEAERLDKLAETGSG